jgi:phage shock protein A
VDQTYEDLKMQLEIARFELYQALERKKRAEKSLERAQIAVSKATKKHTKAIEACNLFTETY